MDEEGWSEERREEDDGEEEGCEVEGLSVVEQERRKGI